MPKGVSAILATVLIVLVTISLAGAFLVYSQRTATQLTESATAQQQHLLAQTNVRFSIDGVSNSQLFLRNSGDTNISHGALSIFLDDVLINYTLPVPIRPGQTGTIYLNETWKTGLGEKNLRVTSRAFSDSVRVRIIKPAGNILDLGFNEQGGTDGSNQVSNSGFETYTLNPGAPNNWTASGTHSYTKETTIVRTGSNSIKMVSDGSPLMQIEQSLSGLSAGKSYYVEAWVSASGGGKPYMRVRTSQTADLESVPACGTTDATSWERQNITFAAQTGVTYAIRLGDCAGTPPGGKTLYWDDIIVQEVQAKDASGNNNHGKLNGNSTKAGPSVGANGKVGVAYSFDGSEDHIEVPHNDSLNLTNMFIVEFWIKNVNQNYGDYGVVVAKKIYQNSGWEVALANGATTTEKRVLVQLNDAGHSTNTTTYQSASFMASVDLVHVTLRVALPENPQIRVYINGTMLSSGNLSASYSTFTNSGNSFTVGNRDGRWFNGILDELRLYKSAYTLDELYVVNHV